MRLHMIGLDGLSSDMFEQVGLPMLKGRRLRWGTSRAPVAMTGPSWTSIFTGQTVKQHGVSSLFGNAVDGSKCFADLPGRYLFEVLPGRTGVFNVPTTHPPRGRPNDWMVSGFPFRPHTYPAGLLDGQEYIADYASLGVQFRVQNGQNTFWPKFHNWHDALLLLDLIEKLHLRVLGQLSGVANLFVVSTYYDRIGHLVGGCPDAPQANDERRKVFRDAARYVLRWALQAIEAKGPADLTVMVSDHGFQLDGGGHVPEGFWCMWGRDVEPGRQDIVNHQLRGLIEKTLGLSDEAEVHQRLVALGYVADDT